MSWLQNLFHSSKETSSDRTLQEEVFRAAGCFYHLKNIQLLAEANPDWRKSGKTLAADGKVMKKIYQNNYIHKPVKLIPEPKNPHDKNAVLIQIAGEPVGYIPAENAVHVKNILAKREIKFLSAFISGGPYKVVSEDGSVVKMESEITITVKIAYV